MARPDLSKVIKMLEAGEDFSLTDKQYLLQKRLERTGFQSHYKKEQLYLKRTNKN